MNTIRFTTCPDTGITYGYDADENQQTLAARRIAEGHIECETPADQHPNFSDVKAGIISNVRADREGALNRLAGIGFRAILTGDTVMAGACATAQNELLALPNCASVVAATDIVSLKAALLDEYQTIVNNSPSSIRDAFFTKVAW